VYQTSPRRSAQRENGARERRTRPAGLCAMLLSRSEDGGLDFNSSPIPIRLAKQAKHVGDQKNQQYCPQSYTSSAARTPAAVAVVSSTEAEDQYQDDYEYQHYRYPYFFDESRTYSGTKLSYKLTQYSLTSSATVQFYTSWNLKP
jgi:hypothetical protein